jgi:protein TonB
VAKAGGDSPQERSSAAASAAPEPPSRRGSDRPAGGASGSGESGGGGAARTGLGAREKALEGRYLADLQRAIAKHRKYPREARRRGLEGVVTVYFVITADGRIRDVRVAKGSGSRLLDEAGIDTLKRLAAFKPIPRELARDRWALRVPIRFALR